MPVRRAQPCWDYVRPTLRRSHDDALGRQRRPLYVVTIADAYNVIDISRSLLHAVHFRYSATGVI